MSQVSKYLLLTIINAQTWIKDAGDSLSKIIDKCGFFIELYRFNKKFIGVLFTGKLFIIY